MTHTALRRPARAKAKAQAWPLIQIMTASALYFAAAILFAAGLHIFAPI